MDELAHLASIEAVLDRARTCLSLKDLPRLVMRDPGHSGDVAAYARVLASGAPEVLREGGKLNDTFEITENCGSLTRTQALLRDTGASSISKARCLELSSLHDQFQAKYVEDEATHEWIPNVSAARRSELVWGASVNERNELRMWIELVKSHFPSSPALTLETRERPLHDGGLAPRK